MRIAVIGIGKIGLGAGERWLAQGRSVVFGVRGDAEQRGAKIEAELGRSVLTRPVREAASDADIVLLAVPWSSALAAVAECGNLQGKTLIDPINSFTPDLALAVSGHTSVAEEIAKSAPGAHVVKALNTLGASNLKGLDFGGEVASGFHCGDDAGAKSVVENLLRDIGFDPVDCGPLVNARQLEQMALLWGRLAFAQGYGPEIAFKLLRRAPAASTEGTHDRRR